MAGEWQSVPVGEIAESISNTHQMDKDELVFLNTSDVLLGKVLHSTYSAVRNWPGQAKKSIRRNDILFSEIRPSNGRWAFIDFDSADFVVSTKLMVIRPRSDRVLPRFFYHFLTSKQTTQWLQHLAESRSGTFPQITFDQVAELEIGLPSLKIQSTIVGFLDSIDDKIELNRQMNETLEAMARALFKSWFIDFDPVRAKMEGLHPGLPKEISDLFPARFVDSELGEIPEGWKVGFLSNLVAYVVERVDPSPLTESAAYVPIECISPRTVCLYEWQPGSNARSSLILFKQGDILFGAMRPYFHKVCLAPFDGTTRTTAFVFRPEASELGYTVFVISQDETIEYATSYSEGSTIPYAKWNGSLEYFPVVLPPTIIRQRFDSMIKPLLNKMMIAVVESRTLAALRDALLPKLISGELRVKDAERFVEGRV